MRRPDPQPAAVPLPIDAGYAAAAAFGGGLPAESDFLRPHPGADAPPAPAATTQRRRRRKVDIEELYRLARRNS